MGSAACGQQVIDQKDRFTRRDGVIMDFDNRLAVFQLIVLADRCAGQLALFPDRNKAGAKLMSNRPA